MTKTVKVFGIGKWNNIEFTKEKVKSLIDNTKEKVKAIYAHTSKWKKEGKEPIDIGEFSNIRLQDNDVVAELKLNKKGTEYYNDGIIKGISAEVTNSFDKIAALPIGITQAVEGAEFEEQVMEFEEIKNNLEGGEEMSLKDQIKSLTKDEKLELAKGIFKCEGLEFEIKEPESPKTEKEIRAEVRAEIEEEAEMKATEKAKNEAIECALKELKDDMKLTPVLSSEFKAILKDCNHSEKVDTLEFEEDGKTAIKKTQLERVIEFSKNSLKSYKDLLVVNEFSEKEEKTDVEKYNDEIKGKN